MMLWERAMPATVAAMPALSPVEGGRSHGIA
jgi:hypothetical protein